MIKRNEIGLIGKGFVGQCVYDWFGGKIPYATKSNGNFKAVNKKRVIFLCLPTPYSPKTGFVLNHIINNLKKLSPGKIIIIKSTVLPNTTEKLAERFKQHKLFFNPEFLREKTAFHDFIHPDRQIIGITNPKDFSIAQQILRILPKSKQTGLTREICQANNAEMLKLVSNCFLALKVVFANQIFDYCQKKNVNYNLVIDMLTQDPRIGKSHFRIFADHGKSGRGYGGHCFPKDMSAMIFDSKSELLRKAKQLNNYYLKQ